MNADDVTRVIRDALFTIIKCAMPMLLVSLVVGLAVSIFQTVTSIQEQTLTFVPKVICVFLALTIAGNWMVTNLVGFMTDLWGQFAVFIR